MSQCSGCALALPLRAFALSSQPSLALKISPVARRYRIDGQELESIGVTYLLHRSDTGWKIVVVVLHDRDEVVRQPGVLR
jgi:hypothetical protein